MNGDGAMNDDDAIHDAINGDGAIHDAIHGAINGAGLAGVLK
jgi:hypothetical protein